MYLAISFIVYRFIYLWEGNSMAKIKMVIADTDEDYIEGLYNFITCNYFGRFQLSSYTRESYLLEFLDNNTDKIDILLISPELYSDQLQRYHIKTVIILSSGKLASGIENFECINKYQHAGKLINQILNIYAEQNHSEVSVNAGSKKTKVVGFYSPVGGSGKTTVSIVSSIISTQMGRSAFYLNFEDFHSTPLLLNCENHLNLSNILYYLKEKNKNIMLKMEACRCIDDVTGIHYFMPPESIIEMDEMLPEELQQLIIHLKNMSYYDVVFVDMSSSFNRKNVKLMESCDEVIIVLTQDSTTEVKVNSFIKELDILSSKNGSNLLDKLTFVLNKSSIHVPTYFRNLNFNGKTIAFSLPQFSTPITRQTILHYANSDNEFSKNVNQLLNHVLG